MERGTQRLRVWGAWLTVRSTHTEPCATLGTAVVLGLDDGPPLRVQATDPLSVQR
ncbi:hypothetical protein [Streptomyces sp. NPDC046939]|uniref:hypothetical protein n=1 Tax=Streptomyces sp. NPDC046939 TaxID=3155376 RepID=UPI0034061791